MASRSSMSLSFSGSWSSGARNSGSSMSLSLSSSWSSGTRWGSLGCTLSCGTWSGGRWGSLGRTLSCGTWSASSGASSTSLGHGSRVRHGAWTVSDGQRSWSRHRVGSTVSSDGSSLGTVSSQGRHNLSRGVDFGVSARTGLSSGAHRAGGAGSTRWAGRARSRLGVSNGAWAVSDSQRSWCRHRVGNTVSDNSSWLRAVSSQSRHYLGRSNVRSDSLLRCAVRGTTANACASRGCWR